MRTGRVLTGGNLLLQLSLNGDDYDVGGARFYYYSVGTAFPRRGPSTGQSTVRLSTYLRRLASPLLVWQRHVERLYRLAASRNA